MRYIATECSPRLLEQLDGKVRWRSGLMPSELPVNLVAFDTQDNCLIMPTGLALIWVEPVDFLEIISGGVNRDV